jgi:hypothetical protein
MEMKRTENFRHPHPKPPSSRGRAGIGFPGGDSFAFRRRAFRRRLSPRVSEGADQ